MEYKRYSYFFSKGFYLCLWPDYINCLDIHNLRC